MLGGSGHAPRENFEMIDVVWCVLMYYFVQITTLSLKKVLLLITENINYSYTPGYTLAMGDAL